MRKLLGAAVLGLGLASGSAQADALKLYTGIGVGDSSLERSGGSDLNLGTLSAKLGLSIGGILSLEADVGVMSDDSSSIASESVVNYQAFLGRLGWTFDRTHVYGLAGQARVETDLDLAMGGEGLGSRTETVNVFGAGVSLFGNEKTAINLEFRDFDDGGLTTVHIGIRHFFGGFR
jgi:hypothetical protein